VSKTKAGERLPYLLSKLKAPRVLERLEQTAALAREQEWPYERFLETLLEAEVFARDASGARMRVRAAGFPAIKTLEDFDWTAQPSAEKPLVLHLAQLSWIEERGNVCFLGPPGTGKTHLAIALGVEAARQRRRVAFWRAADLVRTLVEARDAKEVGRTMRRLERVDLVIVDELGFVPFDRQGGELLFNVFASRHGRRSVCITTNLAFSEWPRVFGGDEKLTTALLDRLAEHAIVIATKGRSYRMRKRRAEQSNVQAAIEHDGNEVATTVPPKAETKPAGKEKKSRGK
jgi:DNA replication protein DnaC